MVTGHSRETDAACARVVLCHHGVHAPNEIMCRNPRKENGLKPYIYIISVSHNTGPGESNRKPYYLCSWTLIQHSACERSDTLPRITPVATHSTTTATREPHSRGFPDINMICTVLHYISK